MKKNCPKCGTSLEESDVFCTNCGASIDESVHETIPTANNVSKAQSIPSIEINLGVFAAHLQTIKNIYIGIIFKPVTTIGIAIEHFTIRTNIILSALLGIVYGIFCMTVVKLAVSNVENMAKGILSVVIKLLGIEISDLINAAAQFSKYLEIPYGKLFGYTFLLVLLLILLMAIILFVTVKYVFHSNIDFAKPYTVVTVAVIPLLNFTIVSYILGKISGLLGYSVMFASIGIVIICIFYGISIILSNSYDSAAFAVTLSFVFFYIISILCGKSIIISKIKAFTSNFVF